MIHLTHPTPPISEPRAHAILSELYGLSGSLSRLPSERDANFKVRADAGTFVLKIASAQDEERLLLLQNAAMVHVASRSLDVGVPRPVPSLAGRDIEWVELEGERHAVRLLTWLPGRVLGLVKPHSPALLASLGDSLGALDAALADFAAPEAARTLKWDLTRALWCREVTRHIADGDRRARVDAMLGDYEQHVLPALSITRRSVIHNDANDFNVVVSQAADGAATVSGLLDFGDLVETHTVCELAIALAYAMMGKADPIGAAAHVVAAYHRRFPLGEGEIELLVPLARTRLAITVTNAALQRVENPQNEYLSVSETAAWELLDRLAAVPESLATYRLRAACGLEPCPTSVQVREWIDRHRGELAPVVTLRLDDPAVPVFDLSVSSTELGVLDEWTDAERLSRKLFDRMRDAGASVGIGRYDEVRALYTSNGFQMVGNDGEEWRTVHVGIDVFLAPGAPVFAPLDGVVHSVADNANPLDYGPTIILEHRVDGGALVFFTLYGHLSRESLATLREGDRVARGQRFATIGELAVNGGWPPHLHFQIVCDLLGKRGDFPGVAAAAERDVWCSISPDPTPMLGLAGAARAPRASSVAALRDRRAQAIGPSLSVSYRRPLQIVRGRGQFLIDADGRRYLDAVNNVAHVGHAHPVVVRAGQAQMAVLNTNTRYLHALLLTYAERLTATLPEPLRVCYFVCSGSEANELALRLARAHTGERDVVALKAGYHGNTAALVDVSSYKFDGPGGSGAPPWVQVVPMPDTYRGPFRRDDDSAGIKYAQAVREAVGHIRRAGRRPAAFLCESILSCGGQIVLPPDYLSEAYRHVRAAGGVCIADEVQVGFGRAGSHFWAFATQDVVPDIVTLGKPIGNGHPLGAVVTTPEIAASFANGMEYFNTFGGNPVSCAIGLAVLDVMEREQLQAQAARVGGYLQECLTSLLSRHELVGDVRGLGLFIGVELVTDREARTPATRQASYVANRMRDRGVLMSTDGPDNNVLKIKPPLVFGERDADALVECLDFVLSEDAAQPGFGV